MEKIKLDSPIIVDGVEVKELTLRKPKMKDLIAISKKDMSDAERDAALIANLAEISIDSVGDLSISDYMKIQKWLQHFLSPMTQKA